MTLVYHGYRPIEEHFTFIRQYDPNMYSLVHQFLRNPQTLAQLSALSIRKSCNRNVIYAFGELLKFNEKLTAVSDLILMREVPFTNLISF